MRSSTEASAVSDVPLRPLSRAKSDSLRSVATVAPAALRGNGGSASSPLHDSTSLAARSKPALLPRLRLSVRSSPNSSTFSTIWSGWKSSIEPIGTATVPSPPSSDRFSASFIRASTSSRLSTSTLIGLRRASASPVSARPALARPEKSPSKARRNFTPGTTARGLPGRLPKLTLYCMLCSRLLL